MEQTHPWSNSLWEQSWEHEAFMSMSLGTASTTACTWLVVLNFWPALCHLLTLSHSKIAKALNPAKNITRLRWWQCSCRTTGLLSKRCCWGNNRVPYSYVYVQNSTTNWSTWLKLNECLLQETVTWTSMHHLHRGSQLRPQPKPEWDEGSSSCFPHQIENLKHCNMNYKTEHNYAPST